jgi:SAM-dependent methyltransferase
MIASILSFILINMEKHKGWEHSFKSDGENILGKSASPWILSHFPERTGEEGKPQKVLDLGAGTARNSMELLRRGYDITLADISESGLKIAKKNLDTIRENARTEAGIILPQEKIFQGGFFEVAEGLGNQGIKFDAIISVSAMEHIFRSRHEELLHYLNNLLNDEGKLYYNITTSQRVKNMLAYGTREAEAENGILLDGTVRFADIEGKGNDPHIPHMDLEEGEMREDLENSGFRVDNLRTSEKGEISPIVDTGYAWLAEATKIRDVQKEQWYHSFNNIPSHHPMKEVT